MIVLDLRGTMAMRLVAMIQSGGAVTARLVSEEDFVLSVRVAGPAEFIGTEGARHRVGDGEQMDVQYKLHLKDEAELNDPVIEARFEEAP